MMESKLTKEFWDGLMKLYPDQYNKLNQWITKYLLDAKPDGWVDQFHNLPDAMQFGVFLEYYSQQTIAPIKSTDVRCNNSDYVWGYDPAKFITAYFATQSKVK